MTTALICMEIWPIWPQNCLVMLRNGTTTAMDSAMPDSDTFGVPRASRSPPASATTT